MSSKNDQENKPKKDWMKILTKHIRENRFVSKTCKEFNNSIIINNPIFKKAKRQTLCQRYMTI